MKSNAADIKARISEVCSHLTFQYKGQGCGVDPLSPDHFDMWCGDSCCTAKSIDEVMTMPFFDGKDLLSIANEVDILDW